MAIAFWDDSPSTWDQLILGDKPMPGVWDVQSGGVGRRLDVKSAKGSDGARIKDEGYDPARIELRGRIISKADWDDLVKRLKDLHPRKKGATRDPLFISHPITQSLGIDAVYVENIPTGKWEGGFFTQSIRVIEWTKVTLKKKGTDKVKKPGDVDVLAEPTAPNNLRIETITNI